LNGHNNWNVSYSTIVYFESALSAHPKVRSVSRKRDLLFEINLVSEKQIIVLLVNEYTLGLAAVHRALAEFPSAEFIVTGSNWSSYTRDAKDFGSKSKIGIFQIGEFLAALNSRNPKSFHRKDANGNPLYAYREA
jgi:hypothetical protein